MPLLRTVVRSEGITGLVATHDPLLVDLVDAAFKPDDGGAFRGVLAWCRSSPGSACRGFASLQGDV